MKNIRENVGEMLDLQLPSSKKEIAQIQSAQKKVALTQAKKAKFYQGRLDHVDPNNLDDPVEWARIPIIDKEKLRELGVENFSELFCIAEQKDIAEYWRSGGATGVPLFYPAPTRICITPIFSSAAAGPWPDSTRTTFATSRFPMAFIRPGNYGPALPIKSASASYGPAQGPIRRRVSSSN